MHYFIVGCGVVLAGWLVAAFFHDVAVQQYPKQRRVVPVRGTGREPAKAEVMPVVDPDGKSVAITPTASH